MKLSIAKKLVISYFVLTAIVIISGVTGIYMVAEVADSGNVVLDEKIPLKDVSMEAMIASGRAMESCRELMHSRDHLEPIEEKIRDLIWRVYSLI